MFTGIIQSIGKVVKYDGKRLWITAPFKKIVRGESISIDGVCLTAVAQKKGALAFDVGPVTRRITTLGNLARGARVNLERALRVGDRLGGHWVSGHVEETGKNFKDRERLPVVARSIRFRLPRAVREVCGGQRKSGHRRHQLDGGRGACKPSRIMIIPHTLSHTTLVDKKVGDAVNLETDL